jgi:hypothetical protein
MVNEICNLRCPYCFAGEFVNRDPREMTLADFKTALEFALGDHSERQVGIIGGEPLLYPHINEVLKAALDDPRSDPVMIYTNAVDLERIAPENLESSKFRMLVNCNSPKDMGEVAFEKMRRNLLRFKHEHFGDGRFRLSINLYKPDFDYSYVIPLVKELEFEIIRLSVSVPPRNVLGGMDALEYFRSMKPVALGFVGDMIRCGALTGFDCNFLPGCVLTAEERAGLARVKDIFYSGLAERYSRTFWQRAILCEVHNCTPVIDILPDLTAIRCFGLSEHTKRDIRDFRGISALRKHYLGIVDRPACALWASSECKDCYERVSGDCSGGCHVFKAGRLFQGGAAS